MTEFVRNAWYVAAWSTTIDENLQSQTILGDQLVLFRDSSGRVVALEDRCPHRQLPLSHGHRIGDAIQCGYHGLTFAADGRCVRVPGQDNIPPTACVASYPVHERYGIVFIWMGEPDKANEEDVFRLPQLEDPGWHAHHGDALSIDAHYLNVAENLVDPAHVSFVHPTTLGNAASEDVPVHVDTDGEILTAWRWIRDAPPVGFFQRFGAFTGHVDRWHYYYLHLPCTAVIDFGSADTSAGLDEGRRDEGLRIFALHFLTPVSSTRTIDRWMHVRNTALDDESVSATMDAMFRVAFDEDKAILGAIEQEQARIPPPYSRQAARKPIRLAIDKAPLVYRRRIAELLEAERPA